MEKSVISKEDNDRVSQHKLRYNTAGLRQNVLEQKRRALGTRFSRMLTQRICARLSMAHHVSLRNWSWWVLAWWSAWSYTTYISPLSGYKVIVFWLIAWHSVSLKYVITCNLREGTISLWIMDNRNIPRQCSRDKNNASSLKKHSDCPLCSINEAQWATNFLEEGNEVPRCDNHYKLSFNIHAAKKFEEA